MRISYDLQDSINTLCILPVRQLQLDILQASLALRLIAHRLRQLPRPLLPHTGAYRVRNDTPDNASQYSPSSDPIPSQSDLNPAKMLAKI
jgi:hypothetical protein